MEERNEKRRQNEIFYPTGAKMVFNENRVALSECRYRMLSLFSLFEFFKITWGPPNFANLPSNFS